MYLFRVSKPFIHCSSFRALHSKQTLSVINGSLKGTPSRMASNETRQDVQEPTNKSPNKSRTIIVARELLQRRLAGKINKRNLSPQNNAFIQIIGTYSMYDNPSILVYSEGHSYMFNCDEGLQRFCYSNKIKLLSLENVFMTNHIWPRAAGTLGLSLTLQNMGATNVTIRGGDGIENIFNCTEKFMHFNTGIECRGSTYREARYEDAGIVVEAIPIEPDVKSAKHSDNSSKRRKSTPRLIAYSCKLPDVGGRLDPEKCKQLGVPVGPQLAKLKAGHDIKLQNGTIVRSDDVCSKGSVGLNFIVIECASKDYIEKLRNNASLEKLRNSRRSTDEDGQQVELVIHLTPPEVTNDQNYISWMNGFDDSCRHVLLASDKMTKPIHMLAMSRMYYVLTQLDNVIFPVTKHLSAYDNKNIGGSKLAESTATVDPNYEEDENILSDKNCLEDFGKVLHLDTLDKITLRPHKFVEVVREDLRIDNEYQLAKVNILDFDQLLTELKEVQKTLPQAKHYEPEVIFLGTASALPSKYRNTSAILVNLTHPKPASVLMDCGEDTYGQLVRYYGLEKAGDCLKQLKLIYVSHHHADHHVGLLRLLLERRKLTQEPILLLLPPAVDELLNYHNENFDDLSETYEILLTSSLTSKENTTKELPRQVNHLVKNIVTLPVVHCTNSFAVLFEFNIAHPEMESFSIAYSGDARPSDGFAAVARDCDLLIHEATFDYRSMPDALAKKHCTSTEAIELSKKMRAKFTVLTHFSQRLCKIPYFTPEFNDKIGFAFDNMTLRCPSDFPRLPILKPILSSIFKEFLDNLDMKYIKMVERQQVSQDLMKKNAV